MDATASRKLVAIVTIESWSESTRFSQQRFIRLWFPLLQRRQFLALHLAKNLNCIVGTQNAAEVVILQGVAELTTDADIRKKLEPASLRTYGMSGGDGIVPSTMCAQHVHSVLSKGPSRKSLPAGLSIQVVSEIKDLSTMDQRFVASKGPHLRKWLDLRTQPCWSVLIYLAIGWDCGGFMAWTQGFSQVLGCLVFQSSKMPKNIRSRLTGTASQQGQSWLAS